MMRTTRLLHPIVAIGLCLGLSGLLGGCNSTAQNVAPVVAQTPPGPGEGLAPGEGIELSGGRFRSTEDCLAYFRATLPPGAALDGCLETGI
jgi:hypothetical protein